MPRSVRAALSFGVGDTIVYAIEGDHVIMTKAEWNPPSIPTATFDEWNSETTGTPTLGFVVLGRLVASIPLSRTAGNGISG